MSFRMVERRTNKLNRLQWSTIATKANEMLATENQRVNVESGFKVSRNNASEKELFMVH